jgi:enediyne biosynthesis protein E4
MAGLRKVIALLIWLALQLPVSGQQQNPPRTGRSYDTAAPSRKPPPPAPQYPSPVTFTDLTAQSGITFKQTASPTSQKYLPETMGGGVALFDYDNDGLMDVSITTLSNETYPIFHNNGDLTFNSQTAVAGVGTITLLYTGWGDALC